MAPAVPRSGDAIFANVERVVRNRYIYIPICILLPFVAEERNNIVTENPKSNQNVSDSFRL